MGKIAARHLRAIAYAEDLAIHELSGLINSAIPLKVDGIRLAPSAQFVRPLSTEKALHQPVEADLGS